MKRDFAAIADKLKEYGIQPWPVSPGKAPAISGWANRPNWEEPENLAQHYTDDGYGILMGERSGHLEMIEFEGRAMNDDTYENFVDRLIDAGMDGIWENIKTGWSVTSPSQGLHVYFRTDGPSKPNTKLAMRPTQNLEREAGAPRIVPLIETRGEGGFVVGMGSGGEIHPSGGTWQRCSGGPKTVATITCDQRDAIYAIAISFDERPKTTETMALPGSHEGSGDLQRYVVNEIGIDRLLTEDGWTFSHEDTDGAQHWTRPGKDLRDGTSATLYPDGVLVIWTSTVSANWDAILKESSSGYSWASPTGVLAAVRYSGDLREAMSYTRGCITSLADDATDIATEASGSPSETSEESEGLTLPESFWERREVLQHIRQAAYSAGGSADVTLIATLARAVTLVPPSWAAQPLVGRNGGALNIFAALVGPSGSGKTTGEDVARDLMPLDHRKDVLPNIKPSSGEGLIEAFIKDMKEEGPDGKTHRVRRQAYLAGYAYIDEGEEILRQGERDGSTVMSILRSAWSGALLGQDNATQERIRKLEAGKYRLCLVMGLQWEYAAHLIHNGVEGGTPQRFTFINVTDPNIPDRADRPEWPGPLEIGSWPHITGTTQHITVPDTIADEMDALATDWRRGVRAPDPLEAQMPLRRTKLACALAIIDQRAHTNEEDWELAEMIDNVSAAVRTKALRIAQQRQAEATAAAGRRQAHIESAREDTLDAEEARKVDKLTDKIVRHLEATEDGRMSRGKLSRDVANKRTRERYDAALELGQERGLITIEPSPNGQGEHVVLA